MTDGKKQGFGSLLKVFLRQESKEFIPGNIGLKTQGLKLIIWWEKGKSESYGVSRQGWMWCLGKINNLEKERK